MLTRCYSICLLTTLGCGRLFGVEPPVLGADGSIVGDSLVDARLCFGSGAYALCLSAAPTSSIVFPSSVIDTTSSNQCSNEKAWSAGPQRDACFVVGTTITISDLIVVGSRPIVFVATDTIIITGTLEVASHTGEIIGPGSPSSDCAAFPTVAESDLNGAGGGAGASFMSSGNNGGDGNDRAAQGGFAAEPLGAAPTVLRAGCRGQNGGSGGLSAGGRGGDGGGAVYLVAGTKISLNGVINASGAGAGVALLQAGGGGGGSGGMIVLYAPTIDSVASGASGGTLLANGGSGSSGANSGAGTAGNDPSPQTPLAPATGPAGPSGAGAGGAGYAVTSAAGLGGMGALNTGGGGGGGGGGYIQANVANEKVTASPAITIIP